MLMRQNLSRRAGRIAELFTAQRHDFRKEAVQTGKLAKTRTGRSPRARLMSDKRDLLDLQSSSSIDRDRHSIHVLG